jgi:hypothetical protein
LILASFFLFAPQRPSPVSTGPAPLTVELLSVSMLSTAPTRGAAQPEAAPSSQPAPPSDPPPEPSLPPDLAPPKPMSALEALAALPPVDFTAQPVQLAPRTLAPQTPTSGPVLSATSAHCDLTGAIQAALESDPKKRDQLALIPPQARSVANAVQLWDGAWVDPDSLGGPAVAEPIRAAIVDVIRQAPPACHDQTLMGPRLFAIADPRGTIIVALGSGQWKWSDLLAPSPTPASFLGALFNP